MHSHYHFRPGHLTGLFLLFAVLSASAQQFRLDLSGKLAPLEIDHMALGQGGLSEQPMWDDRVNEIRMLSRKAKCPARARALRDRFLFT